ncbi:MAG TPA: hypothetical protein VGR00_12090, partial [Thermoanaerobaculia bacterium]|nr:hypothetical protein [Thermoanaerobaculia bacterium]
MKVSLVLALLATALHGGTAVAISDPAVAPLSLAASHAGERGTSAAAPVTLDPSGLMGVKARDTFSGDVVRILQAHCQSCHHEGDIAPFPLITYRDAFEHRDAIRQMTSTRQMPPWHMGPCQDFENDASLSNADIQTISRWVAMGAPEGDPKELPLALTFPNTWKLGTPDLVLTMAQAFTPDLSKGDVYRCFVLPTNEGQDRWVNGVEVKPGSRPMVHHVLLFIDTGTTSQAKDDADPLPGYACFGGPGFDLTSGGGLGGWAPGARPQVMPEGVGTFLPKNSRVVMQVHYSVKSGVMEPDTTSVGVYYSKTPVKKRYRNLP